MKISKKYKVLPMGRNNARHQHMLDTTQLQSSSAEKALRVLVDTVDHKQHALAAEKAKGILDCIGSNGGGNTFQLAPFLWCIKI